MFRDQRDIDLALRKQALQQQSAVLRERLAGHAAAVAPALALVDEVRSGWRWVRDHPLVPLAAGLGLLLLRPRATFRLLRRGVVVWQIVRRFRRWSARPRQPIGGG